MIKNLGYTNIVQICFWLVCFLAGWYFCSQRYALEISEYKLEAEKQKTKLLQEVAKTEQLSREKIANIERDNLTAQNELKAEYENTISNLRTKYKLTNSVQCNSARSSNGMPSKARNTAEIKCYTESELYRKIEASLAIAHQCDKLAIDYNALLEVCK